MDTAFEVLGLLLPLLVFCLLFSLLVYFVFEILLKRLSASEIPAEGTNGESALDSLSYILMASLFGGVIGMLVQLFGGFNVLTSGNNAIFEAIGSIVVVVLGVAASLFSETGKISLRRPVGAIALLVSFLVSGFYWQFLKGAVGE